MQRVLMIDDDTELCEMVGEYLGMEGFTVEAVHDGLSGIQRLQQGGFALVLLDVMLPQLNGFDVLRRIRAADLPISTIPVLMLTARGNAIDRIVGLEVGADDYLPKPFEERELVARMRAILRRAGEVPKANVAVAERQTLQVGDVEMDAGARLVRRNGEAITLTAVEFQLLALLLRAAGSVVGREQIAEEVLDRKLMAFDRSIDTHVGHLRRKLGPHPDGSERIKTVRSVGHIYTLPSQIS
jgi:two-component system response regulator CpxR